MARLRSQIDYGSSFFPVNDLEKSNQFFSGISADEIAAVHKSRIVLSHLINRPAEIGIGNALTGGRVIVHFTNPRDEFVVESSDPNRYATLLRPSDILSSFLREFFPPVREAGQLNRCDAVPFHRIRVFWGRS